MKNEIAQFVGTQLPRHFADNAPRMIDLLNLYYKWMYRKDGMSQNEIEDFRSDTGSWLTRNIDKFIATGSARYIGINGAEQAAEHEVTGFRAPGALSDRFHAQFVFDREFDTFETADGDFFFDSNDTYLEAPYVLEDVVNSWAAKFNHVPTVEVNELSPHDEILLIKTLKHMYAAKGTKKCIELFFSIYFGEVVTIYYPKYDICYIDDNFVLDHLKYVRDDNVFQEYSYVINVKNEPSYYEKALNDVYLKNFHPGGFKLTLKKVP